MNIGRGLDLCLIMVVGPLLGNVKNVTNVRKEGRRDVGLIDDWIENVPTGLKTEGNRSNLLLTQKVVCILCNCD